uniref:Uncharacterized protein n=1 Tax=Cacopsylla melanoneura TaxID=428564 RepID=A0A8D8YY14_9HEMI
MLNRRNNRTKSEVRATKERSFRNKMNLNDKPKELDTSLVIDNLENGEKTEYVELKSEIKKLKEKHGDNKISDIFNVLIKKWTEGRGEIHTLHEGVAKLEQEIKDKNIKCISLEQKKQDAEARINSLLTENDDETSELSFMIKEKDKELKRLKARINQLEKYEIDLNSTSQSMKETVRVNEELVRSTDTLKTTFKEQINEKNEHIHKLLTDIKALEHKIHEDKTRIDTLIEESGKQTDILEIKLRQKDEELSKRDGDLKKENIKLSELKEYYEEEIENYKKLMEEKSKDLAVIQKKEHELSRINAILRDQVVGMRTTISLLEKTISSHQLTTEVESTEDDHVVDDSINVHLEFNNTVYELNPKDSLQRELEEFVNDSVVSVELGEGVVNEGGINVGAEKGLNSVINIEYGGQEDSEQINDSTANACTGQGTTPSKTLDIDSINSSHMETNTVGLLSAPRTSMTKKNPKKPPPVSPEIVAYVPETLQLSPTVSKYINHTERREKMTDVEVALQLKIEELEGEIISNRQRISRIEHYGAKCNTERQNQSPARKDGKSYNGWRNHRDQNSVREKDRFNRIQYQSVGQNNSVVEVSSKGRNDGVQRGVGGVKTTTFDPQRSAAGRNRGSLPPPRVSEILLPGTNDEYSEKQRSMKTCFILGDSQGRNLKQYLEENTVEKGWSFRSFVSPGANLLSCIDRGLDFWNNQIKNSIECHFVIVAGTIDCAEKVNWKNVDMGIEKLKFITNFSSVTVILTPFRLDCGRLNDNVYKFNRRLKEKLGGLSNLTFIDPYEVIPEITYYNRDGYHLNENAKRILARSVSRTITQSNSKTVRSNFW